VTEQADAGALFDYIDGATMLSGADWDYSSWTPNAVIFWVGVNDNHTSLHSPKFCRAYGALMEHAAAKYAYAAEKPKLIHVCASLDGSGNGCSDIQTVIGNFNSGRQDGFESFYAPISPSVWSAVRNNRSLHGCDRHPNPKGYELVKSDLVAQVRSILGWSSSSDVVVV